MRRAFPLGIILVLSLAVRASSESGSTVAKSVEVSVTNVDVVVTDANGKPIADLTPADFEVKQDGVVQPLTNFSFIRNTPPAPAPSIEGAPPVPPPPASALEPSTPPATRAHLIVFFDMLHLTTPSKNRAIKSLLEYLPTVVGPNVEAQFVTWDRALRIRGPFTTSVPVLSSLLESIGQEATLGEVAKRERDLILRQIDAASTSDARTRADLFQSAISALRAWCDMQAPEVDSTIDALRASFSAVAGVEGRKILFVITEKFTPIPGRDLWDYVLYGTARTGSSLPLSQGTGVNGLSFTNWDRSAAFRTLTRAANAAGISLVAIDAEGLITDELLTSENPAGLGRMDESIGQQDMQTAFGVLADETGGRMIAGRNDLDLALRSMEADWTAYYSLGYESPSAKPGEPRSIRVTVKRPGARVLSRKTVVERTPEEKVADGVLSGVYIPHTTNPLRASLNTGTPKKSGKMWLVPLEFKVPFDKLTLVPQGGRAKGALLFTAVAATPDGRISPVTTGRAPIDVPEADLARLSGKTFTYSATLKVRPGPQIFSMALTDEISRLSSYVQPHVLVGDKPGAR